MKVMKAIMHGKQNKRRGAKAALVLKKTWKAVKKDSKVGSGLDRNGFPCPIYGENGESRHLYQYKNGARPLFDSSVGPHTPQ